MLLVFIFMVTGRDAPNFKTVNNRVMVKNNGFSQKIYNLDLKNIKIYANLYKKKFRKIS